MGCWKALIVMNNWNGLDLGNWPSPKITKGTSTIKIIKTANTAKTAKQ